jgi:hypothetical protein
LKKHNYKNELLLNRAKSIPITDILNYYGIEMKGNKINCLWHDDSSPSAHIYEESNQGYCFGCAQQNFDGITIVMKKEGLDFYNALQFLNHNFVVNDNYVPHQKKNLDMYFKLNDEIRGMILGNEDNININIIKKYGQLMDHFYDDSKVLLRLYRKMLDLLNNDRKLINGNK